MPLIPGRIVVAGGRLRASSVAINVPDPDDPDMDLVYRTESNVIHFRLSSPQRFVVACLATTAAFGLIILLVESKMNWNWMSDQASRLARFGFRPPG